MYNDVVWLQPVLHSAHMCCFYSKYLLILLGESRDIVNLIEK